MIKISGFHETFLKSVERYAREITTGGLPQRGQILAERRSVFPLQLSVICFGNILFLTYKSRGLTAWSLEYYACYHLVWILNYRRDVLVVEGTCERLWNMSFVAMASNVTAGTIKRYVGTTVKSCSEMNVLLLQSEERDAISEHVSSDTFISKKVSKACGDWVLCNSRIVLTVLRRHPLRQ